VVNHPPEDIEQTTDGPGISPGLVAAQPDPVVPEPGVELDEQASNTPPAYARPPDQPTEPRAVIESPPPAAPVLVDLTTPPAALAPLPSHESQERLADSKLPTLGQLPSSARSEIGDLTLNIHVYDDQPEDRFVLINLRRYTEGDGLSGDLIVRQIRPDGVVLALRGQDFLLPSGG
jgi:general secretion pathway protein B